ncbi:MAG TPA: glycoside hydrolase family 2 TIM barrel-domain containing protein, partial [Labilithrix sp.]|nr:glycoside hydrolase family 2 TIM barrel-domain containing protein [Labilithrix sp.]
MPRSHLSQLGVDVGPRSRRDGDHAHGYPRPLMRRDDWTSLNGTWDFALDEAGQLQSPDEVTFDEQIEVPFSPETTKSGIGDTGLYDVCWYRRSFEIGELGPDERLVLHFGAVDYSARVWVDGALAMTHEGGYTPFSADITGHLRSGKTHQIVVRAEDDPDDLGKPRGKQDWQLVPHSIWYPRTTGIWQTVWMERVGRSRVTEIRWTPYLASWELGFDAQVTCKAGQRLSIAVRLHVGDLLIAEDRYAVVHGEVRRRIALSDPGIDDFRNELLWSPSKPTLIEVELDLIDDKGKVLDALSSYTALRSFTCDGGRFILNGRPYPLRLVLDQGYWPETGLTPPDDAALRRDVELTKAMGFNGARKHQKIEDPRYLYWADRLGLLVWSEMPSAYRFTHRSIERVTRQWIEAVRRDLSHPCIVAWVPFNESWGVPNLPDSKPERHYVEGIYHLTKTLDPTRPVIGNDGWESIATDVLGIHDYDASPERLARRYATPDQLPKILKRERPGGRALVIDGTTIADLPVVLSEFGGIAVTPEASGYGSDAGSATWGYSATQSADELGHRYRRLLHRVRGLELLAGFCYTQFADTYQEANGLLYADPRPKFPLAEIAAATSGKIDGDETPPPSLAEV